MARIARIVVPGIPHHVVQRGNRRQTTFFRQGDYLAYLRLLLAWTARHRVQIWAYCLMPNHVHLIAVPGAEGSLRCAISEAHRRYSCMINRREGWTGHLWQGRFFSYPMDEHHLLAAARYIELNPVAAGIVARPEDYPWSSARAHLGLSADLLIGSDPLRQLVLNWRQFLSEGISEAQKRLIEKHERSGRPVGGGAFIRRIESEMGRSLSPKKRGPKRRRRGIKYGVPKLRNDKLRAR